MTALTINSLLRTMKKEIGNHGGNLVNVSINAKSGKQSKTTGSEGMQSFQELNFFLFVLYSGQGDDTLWNLPRRPIKRMRLLSNLLRRKRHEF